jgi:hypothetical protein
MKALTVSQSALVFIGVMVGLSAIGEGAGALIQWAYGRRPPAPVTQQQAARQVPPEPRLEVDLLASRRILVGPERRAGSFGWTDRANGRAHVPVDVAMRLMAKQGWPQPDSQGRSSGGGS